MSLTEIESRRFEMYQEGMTFQEIATVENTSKTAIFKSVQRVKEKLASEKEIDKSLAILRYEVDTITKVVKNQHELINILSKQIDDVSSMVDQNEIKQLMNKLTSETSMMNHLLMKMNSKE